MPPVQAIMGMEGRNGYQKDKHHPYHPHREAARPGDSPKHGQGEADSLKEGPGETTGADSYRNHHDTDYEQENHCQEEKQTPQADILTYSSFRYLLPGVLFFRTHPHQVIRSAIRDLAPWATFFSLG